MMSDDHKPVSQGSTTLSTPVVRRGAGNALQHPRPPVAIGAHGVSLDTAARDGLASTVQRTHSSACSQFAHARVCSDLTQAP